MSKATPSTRSAKQPKPGPRSRWRLWLIGSLLGVFAVGLLVGKAWLYKALRWSERRYFAHIGDKGPLQRLQAGQWKAQRPGLWTRTMLFKRKRHWSRVRLRLMRVDLSRHKLSLWWQKKPRSVAWIMKHTDAVAAINGGLFDPQYRPLGYFKTDGKVINGRQHKRHVDGVMFVRGGRLQIAPGKDWERRGVSLAFQSAPLLVARGKRRPLHRKSWKVDRRSAVCLDAKGRLLLMATDGYINGLSFFELGLLMAAPEARGGLGCEWGLNLDGGSSSQWAVRTKLLKQGKQQLLMTSGIAIPLFLLIRPRQAGEKR